MFHIQRPLRFFPILILFLFPLAGDKATDSCRAAGIENSGFLQEASWIEKTGPGVFRIGTLQVHKRHQSITFPAVFLPANNPIGHFLIHQSRQEKNSLLSTEIDPGAFNVALMMIGLEADSEGEAALPASARNQVSALEVQVAHRVQDGYDKGEACRYVGGTRVKWRYRGGLVKDGKFSAQTEGVLMALGQDPAAVMDNAAAPAEFRSIRTPEGLPAAGTPGIVTIRIPAH